METASPFNSGDALQVKNPMVTDILSLGFRVSGFGSKRESPNLSLSVTRNKKLGTRNYSFAGDLGMSDGDAQGHPDLRVELRGGHQEIVVQVPRREGEAKHLEDLTHAPPPARRPLGENRFQR